VSVPPLQRATRWSIRRRGAGYQWPHQTQSDPPTVLTFLRSRAAAPSPFAMRARRLSTAPRSHRLRTWRSWSGQRLLPSGVTRPQSRQGRRRRIAGTLRQRWQRTGQHQLGQIVEVGDDPRRCLVSDLWVGRHNSLSRREATGAAIRQGSSACLPAAVGIYPRTFWRRGPESFLNQADFSSADSSPSTGRVAFHDS